MLVTREISLDCFEAWSGAEDTLRVLTESDCRTIECLLEDLYPEGMTETQLNDILWFERDWLAEMLGFEDWEALEEDHTEEE